MGSSCGRRPSEEGKCKKELPAYRLGGSRYPCHDADDVRQRLGKGWLYNQVGDVAKCAIGLNRLAFRVYVPGLYYPAEGNKCTA